MGELILSRSVTKHIRKHNKNLVSGVAVGDDCARFSMENVDMVCTEGYGCTPKVAWIKAMNNLATSGAKVTGVRILMLLPVKEEESKIKTYAGEFNQLADEANIQIMGGHTQVSEAYQRASFVVNAFGLCGKYIQQPKEVKPGYQVVMTKWAGLMGSDLLASAKQTELSSRLAQSYIKGGKFDSGDYSVSKEAQLCSKLGDNVCYMHDVSCGGVYGALWQLGSKLGKGLCIDHYKIPIRQETIEFCEIFDLNPYMMEGTGSLLLVARDGQGIVDELMAAGINAAVIGEVTSSKERVVVLGDSEEKRFLAPAKGDEIYKIEGVLC